MQGKAKNKGGKTGERASYYKKPTRRKHADPMCVQTFETAMLLILAVVAVWIKKSIIRILFFWPNFSLLRKEIIQLSTG